MNSNLRTGRLRRHEVVWLAAGTFVMSGAEVVWAQKSANIPSEDSGLVQYVVAALIMLVISITGFLKANRSHKA